MIYYFSATGNSQHVPTRIAEALGTQAQSIETASTEIRLADREPLGFVRRAVRARTLKENLHFKLIE